MDERNFENSQRPKERSDDEGGWRGIPGLTEYGRVQRVRQDRINRWLGPNGAAVVTEQFDWNRSFAPVIEQLRRTKEEELIAQKQQEAEREGKDASDVMARAEIARQVNEEIADMFNDVNLLYNTINKHKNRLMIITSDIPREFQNIAGVSGADNYFLVQGGTREENENEIFKNFEKLNNAGGNTRLDRIFSRRDGLNEQHDDVNFFGWKITIDGRDFVFIWNPDESDSAQNESEKTTTAEQNLAPEEEEDENNQKMAA